MSEERSENWDQESSQEPRPHTSVILSGASWGPLIALQSWGKRSRRICISFFRQENGWVPQVPRIWGPGKSQTLIAPAIILLAALVAVVPQFIRGNSCGHDFDVHLVSWLDCVSAWKHGLLYPHWTPSANYDAGEPRFIFYPPLTWMLGAALGLVLPWSLAPIALTFICLAGTGLATRALALEALEDIPATLAGCAAIFSGFALFTAYERSAFPEFMGGVWMPLILLYALRDTSNAGCPILSRFLRKGGKAQPQTSRSSTLLSRAFDGSTVPLTLALAAAWLSNAPLGVMASYLLAAVALLIALLRRSWAPVLRAAVASALGLGVIAFYLLPAALERAWVDIQQAYNDPGYNFENSWAFAHHADPVLALHDVVLHTASLIAVSMIAVAVVCTVICWRRGTLAPQKSNRSRLWWIPLAVLPAAVFVLLFPISRPIWYLLPEWRFLQYPWRWLEAVEAPMAIFFAAAVWPSAKRWRIPILIACAAAFLAATYYAATTFFQACYPEDTVVSTLGNYRYNVGFEGMYEYEPPDTDRSEIPIGLPGACLVANPETLFGKLNSDGDLLWTPSQNTCLSTFSAATDPKSTPEHFRLSAQIPHSGYLVLRLLNFPAWRVEVNGATLTAATTPALYKRDDGLIAFPVHPGPLNVSVDWTTTPDVTASRWITALCLVLLIALFAIERRSFSTAGST